MSLAGKLSASAGRGVIAGLTFSLSLPSPSLSLSMSMSEDSLAASGSPTSGSSASLGGWVGRSLCVGSCSCRCTTVVATTLSSLGWERSARFSVGGSAENMDRRLPFPPFFFVMAGSGLWELLSEAERDSDNGQVVRDLIVVPQGECGSKVTSGTVVLRQVTCLGTRRVPQIGHWSQARLEILIPPDTGECVGCGRLSGWTNGEYPEQKEARGGTYRSWAPANACPAVVPAAPTFRVGPTLQGGIGQPAA